MVQMKADLYKLELARYRFREKRNRRRFLLGLLIWCSCAWILLHRMYGFSNINGNSMRPAFYNRDFVIYRRGVPDQIEYGDVLIFKSWQDHEMAYVKRVVALPGDVVKVDDKGYLIRDGEEVREAEILYGPQRTDSHIHFPYRVPEDEYFCMGDNRPVSIDSRIHGGVKEEQILGKVVAVVRVGTFENSK